MKKTTMKKRHQGFTLIELMITVAIVGILAAIAYPSYLNQIRKSRRTDAISLLTQAANRQERFYTTQYSYGGTMAELGLPNATENGWYNVSVASADDKGFTLVANAQNDQLKDKCTQYGLNQLGEKTANGDAADSQVSLDCW